MPRPLSGACCRTSHAKTLHRSPIILDKTAWGCKALGVARQLRGRLGKVDHGHVALSCGYVSRQGHTLVDQRLSLPTAWTQEKARLRNAAGPKEQQGYRTRHPLAL